MHAHATFNSNIFFQKNIIALSWGFAQNLDVYMMVITWIPPIRSSTLGTWRPKSKIRGSRSCGGPGHEEIRVIPNHSMILSGRIIYTRLDAGFNWQPW